MILMPDKNMMVLVVQGLDLRRQNIKQSKKKLYMCNSTPKWYMESSA